MLRETYVMRQGRLVPKSQAAPLNSAAAAPAVISDAQPPLRHHSDGKIYDSKSQFRAETRRRGWTEVGNEKVVDNRKFDMPDAKADIARAISELGG